jgi:hypothetical protein
MAAPFTGNEGYAPIDHIDPVPPGTLQPLARLAEFDNNPDKLHAWQMFQHAQQCVQDISSMLHTLTNAVSETTLREKGWVLDKDAQERLVRATTERLEGELGVTTVALETMQAQVVTKVGALTRQKQEIEQRIQQVKRQMESAVSMATAIRDTTTTLTDDDPEAMQAVALSMTALSQVARQLQAMNDDKLRQIAVELQTVNAELMAVRRWALIHHVNTTTTNCAVCYTEPINAFFMPCGHTGCRACLSKVGKRCPMCQGPTTEIKDLYFTGPEADTDDNGGLARAIGVFERFMPARD